jgi:hypothetical protein
LDFYLTLPIVALRQSKFTDKVCALNKSWSS